MTQLELGAAPYCTCRGKCPGYVSLRDPLNKFVCGRCLKPSELVWLASHRICEECGRDIYTRWEIICSSCRTALADLATDLRREGVPADDWPPILTELKSGPWLGWPERAEMARREPYVRFER